MLTVRFVVIAGNYTRQSPGITPEITYDGIGDTGSAQSSFDSPIQSEAPQNSRMETLPASAASDTCMSSYGRPIVPPVRFRDFVS